jgi:uncharacterized OB-fold protein
MSASLHPFPEGLSLGQLRFQRCDDCGHAQTWSHQACSACGGTTLQWHDASGQGEVLAASVISRAPSESSRPLAPYTLVLVALAEGPQVVGHALPGTRIGDRVRAGTFAHGDQALLRFSPSRL